VEFDWLPKELIMKCDFCVARHHKAHGGSLPKILWQRETMLIVGMHGDLLTLLGSATAAWKICLAFGVAAAVALVLAAVLNWWIALALIPLAFGTIYFKKRETESYAMIAAIILAFEMLAGDFAGWGARFPNAMRQARRIISHDPLNNPTRLLDIYLPRRGDLDPILLGKLGPSG
jgi:hypothetical protein